MKTKKLNQLPEFQALAKSLYQDSAAVMVGAGFGRSAANSADPRQKMPLWKDFASALSNGMESEESLLRLAEGYEALHKRQKLNQLIKEKINDPSWQPGELHKQLLELPWSEVLTTNWDTLLERANQEITSQLYETVNYPSDLAQAKSPRLVKLHGTIGVTEHLIFTEEDYRAYPSKYAAFVNFARQVCIEKDLCLLGFSGSDPNFLAWIGWVRDHLKNQSRNIYLVGILNLTSVTRRYYESLHITPIDLAEYTSSDIPDEQHKQGLRLFLSELGESKISDDWTINLNLTPNLKESDPNSLVLLKDYLPILKKERKEYLGWLLCPINFTPPLSAQVRQIELVDFWSKGLDEPIVAEIFYELIWRYRLLSKPIPQHWYEPLFSILNTEKTYRLNSRKLVEVSQSILESVQWQESTSDIENTVKRVLELLYSQKDEWPEAIDVHYYWNSWIAYRNLDFPLLEKTLSEWPVGLPIWQVRKAGLLSCLGNFDEAQVLIKASYQEINRQWRNQPESIYLFSRLAWIHWLWHLTKKTDWSNTDKWPSAYYSEKNCDPWDYLKELDDKIKRAEDDVKKSQGIVSHFHPGSFKDKSATIRLGGSVHPLITLTNLLQTTGTPFYIESINLLAGRAKQAASIDGLDTDESFFWTAITAQSETDDSIERDFSRINLALAPNHLIERWLTKTKASVEYWLKQRSNMNDSHGFMITQLRKYTELMARLAIRTAPDEAVKLFKWAIGLGHHTVFHHFWLHKPLNNLLENSLLAIPRQRQHEVLLESLSFPIAPSLIDPSGGRSWPKVVINYLGTRNKHCSEIAEVIEQLISKVNNVETLNFRPVQTNNKNTLSIKGSDFYPYTDVLMRLLPLHRNNFLLENEKNKLKDSIWLSINEDSELPSTGLFVWTLLEFPHSDTASLKNLIKSYLYKDFSLILDDTNMLEELFYSATSKYKLLPSEDLAESMLRDVLNCVFRQEDPLGMVRQYNKQLKKIIGKILGEVIIPCLPESRLDLDTLEELMDFIDKNPETIEAIAGIPYFASHEDTANKTEQLIDKFFHSGDSFKVWAASKAVYTYHKLKSNEKTSELVNQIINKVFSNESRYISNLLSVLIDLQKNHLLTSEQQKKTSLHLLQLFKQLSYENLEINTYKAIEAPLIRRNCILLAKQLIEHVDNKNELNDLLALGKRDPLPEVRNAELA